MSSSTSTITALSILNQPNELARIAYGMVQAPITRALQPAELTFHEGRNAVALSAEANANFVRFRLNTKVVNHKIKANDVVRFFLSYGLLAEVDSSNAISLQVQNAEEKTKAKELYAALSDIRDLLAQKIYMQDKGCRRIELGMRGDRDDWDFKRSIEARAQQLCELYKRFGVEMVLDGDVNIPTFDEDDNDPHLDIGRTSLRPEDRQQQQAYQALRSQLDRLDKTFYSTLLARTIRSRDGQTVGSH